MNDPSLDVFHNDKREDRIGTVPLSCGRGKSYRLRDPTDITYDTQDRVNNGIVTFVNDSNISNSPLPNMKILPRREDHNLYTLSIKERISDFNLPNTEEVYKDAEEDQVVEEDDTSQSNSSKSRRLKSTDDCKSNPIMEQNLKKSTSTRSTTTTTSSSRNNQVIGAMKPSIYPLEELLTKGYMSFYASNVKDVLKTVSSELQDDVRLIRENQRQRIAQQSNSRKNQLHDKSSGNPQLLTNNQLQGGGDGSTSNQVNDPISKKSSTHTPGTGISNGEKGVDSMNSDNTNSLSTDRAINQRLFRHKIHQYGFNNRTGMGELHKTIRAHETDKGKRYKLFFINDQLAPDEFFHQHPTEFHMFKDLIFQMKDRYKNRGRNLHDLASRIPKFNDEPPITKEYITEYRKRPLPGEELCSRRMACKFFTFFKEHNMGYIGRVFQTPRERKSLEEAKSGLIKENDQYVGNKQHLCIDCLLHDWRIKCYENLSREDTSGMQYNYFTVLCEPGQYHKTAMLPCFHNGKPTGVIGYVPAYSTTKRVVKTIKRSQFSEDKFYKITTNYLAETGMDF